MPKEIILSPEWWQEVLTGWTLDPNLLVLADCGEDQEELFLEFFGEGAYAPSTPKEGGDSYEDAL